MRCRRLGRRGRRFPSYVKWQGLDDIRYLRVNHQESEPNFYTDKWVLREHAEEIAACLDTLLDTVFEAVVVGAKVKDREEWMTAFEDAADATVFEPGDLPIDVDEQTGVAITYTEDRFQYGMENALLPRTTGVRVGDGLPGDEGWIVQNTETLYNIDRALRSDAPVTRKYLHVDGEGATHRFFEAPVGTPATSLFEAAGIGSTIADDQTILQGGPGWGIETEKALADIYVNKSTNGLIVFDADVVEENTRGEQRVDILDEDDWTSGPHETEPQPFPPPRDRPAPAHHQPGLRGLRRAEQSDGDRGRPGVDWRRRRNTGE